MFGIRRQQRPGPHPTRRWISLVMQYAGNTLPCENQVCDPDHRGGEPPAAQRVVCSALETDTLNRFTSGAAAHVLDGKELAGAALQHPPPGGRAVRLEWDWPRPAAGLPVKDFISPSSFHFRETCTFRIGKRYGAVSFPCKLWRPRCARPYPHRLHGGGRKYYGDRTSGASTRTRPSKWSSGSIT